MIRPSTTILFTLFLFISSLCTQYAQAQSFENLVPVIKAKVKTDTSATLLLGTIYYPGSESRPGKKPYANSIEVINAGQPWPPVWYYAAPLYTDEMRLRDSVEKHSRIVMVGYPEIDSGNLSFSRIGLYDDTSIASGSFSI